MKCPKCGGNVRVRDEFCPWCGSANERARVHVQALQKYRTETDATRNELEKQTLSRVPVFVRLLVIALLITGIVLVIFVNAMSWEWEYDARKRASVRRAGEYTAALDELIAEKKHWEFEEFMQRNDISVYASYSSSNWPYRKYKNYDRVCSSFLSLSNSVLKLYPFNEKSWSDMDRDEVVSRIADDTNYFFSSLDTAETDDDVELTEDMKEGISDMESQVLVMLEAYIGLERDETKALRSMTEAERKMTIQRAWNRFNSGGNSDAG